MTRVAVYLRQSQDRENTGYGIDRQREDVAQLVKARGWTITAEFVDNDVSALSRKPRPQFTEMMAGVDAGEFDVIASRHMDRLLRRLAELESVLERCAVSNTVMVTAADGVDTGSDGGRLVARILSSVAQGEVERKSARQRSAVRQAAKQGRWAGGRRAFGYEADGMTIREEEAVMVRQGYRDVLAGESLTEVARRWTATGIPTPQGQPAWIRTSIKDVLTNPRYCALRRHRPADDRADIRANPELGIIGDAQWPAVVDEPTWRTAVRILCDPSRRTGTPGGKGLLTGVARCGVCGETVHRGASAHGVPNYRCVSGKHVARKSEPVDEYVSALAVEMLCRPSSAKLWARQDVDVVALMAESDVLRGRLADLAEDYTTMTREQFRIANEKTRSRLAAIESQIAAAGSGSSSAAAVAASADPAAEWAQLSVAQRRKIIDTIMVVKLNLIGKGTRTFNADSVEVSPR